MCGEKVPDTENPFLCCYNSRNDTLVTPDPNDLCGAHSNESGDDDLLLIPTFNLCVAYLMIRPWLANKEHVLLVGPEACGKRYSSMSHS